MIFDIVEYIIWNGQSRMKVSQKEKECCWSIATVKYRSETYCWTQKLNREDDGVDKYWVILFFLSRLRFETSRLRLRFLAG